MDVPEQLKRPRRQTFSDYGRVRARAPRTEPRPVSVYSDIATISGLDLAATNTEVEQAERDAAALQVPGSGGTMGRRTRPAQV